MEFGFAAFPDYKYPTARYFATTEPSFGMTWWYEYTSITG
jgi:hypothetical protein